MNKSLRALIAVIVLAFAAAGLYYAWFAPTKLPPEKLDVRKQTEPPVALAAESPIAKLNYNPTGEVPAVSTAPIAVTGDKAELVPAPKDAQMPGTPSNIPSGFTVVNTPMQTLPSSLPGFTPVTATGAVVVAASDAPNASATKTVGQSSATAPSPSTIAVPAKGVAPSTANASPTNPSSMKPSIVPVVTPALKATTSEPAPIVHVVVEGDTLTSIAKQYWGTSQGWENIEKVNPGLTPTNLKLGAKLNIPAKETAVSAPMKSSSGASSTFTSGAVSASTSGDYEIISGDTLYKISSKIYGDAKYWRDIYEANKKTIGEDPAALVVGTKLTIPAKAGSAAKPISGAAPTTTPATKSTPKPAPTSSPATKPPTSTSAPTATPPIGSPATKPPTSTSAPTATPPIGSPTTKPPTSTSAPTATPPIGSPTKP
ncbi:MAG: LysM peptidoglycan-binding domain-containing protein [Phycisphaerales bacterium]|nr:LysM peptidoglycan-binding domain-containing protein [Phycisphaerales bacterium]